MIILLDALLGYSAFIYPIPWTAYTSISLFIFLYYAFNKYTTLL